MWWPLAFGLWPLVFDKGQRPKVKDQRPLTSSVPPSVPIRIRSLNHLRNLRVEFSGIVDQR